MKELNNLHYEKDKTNAPFLLAASFNGLVKFLGSNLENGILVWKFTPEDAARNLVNQLRTRTEPHIPAKDLFEAISAFWQEISGIRNGEKRNVKS